MTRNSLWTALAAMSLQLAQGWAGHTCRSPSQDKGASLFVTESAAKPQEVVTMAPPTVVTCAEQHSRLQWGGNYTYVVLRPDGLPSFRGNLGGAQASYEYRPLDSFYGGLTVNWKQGRTHGDDGKRHLLYVDLQERLGYTAACRNNDLRFTFFTGLGYRHLGQKFIPTQGSILYFRYNELYIPVGTLIDYSFNRWFALGLDFVWMPQVYPTVLIVPLKGARWVLTEKLANFYAALPFDFTLTRSQKWHLVIKPFYERWKDGHSTAVTSTGIPLGLPGNAYNFWGVDVNFAYCF
ncbi:MAG: hypothetical protein FJZ63_02925 [Chlamydiae bacterium]|nr:hypothetical protein [Chlamydiota bacterium]